MSAEDGIGRKGAKVAIFLREEKKNPTAGC